MIDARWPRATRSSPPAACWAGSPRWAESFVSLEASSGVEVQCQRSAVVQVLPSIT